MDFRVDQIDHVELTVPDRRAAASWYCRVLGFKVIQEFEFWADDPGGPLMIGTENAGTKLAFFTGQATGSKKTSGFHLVAFRVDSKQFVKFVEQLPALMLRDHHDQVVTKSMVADHQCAFSIYFCDPYGHQLEITTYDHAATQTALKQLKESSR
jgi:catechol 2,3-dioxygenase